MAFEQDLRGYLESLERERGAEPPPVREIDEADLHHYFVERLRALERAGGGYLVRPLFQRWPSQLAALARFLEVQPAPVIPVERDAARAYAHRVIDLVTGDESGGLLVERLELQRLLAAFAQSETDSYALENRLVDRASGRRRSLTELGRVVLRLRGKDAVRWLLTNETIQSTGPSDPWHATSELLEAATADEGLTVVFDGERGPRYDPSTLRRLVALGVLEDRVDEVVAVGDYAVRPAMRDVVQAVLEHGPWHTAVRALLDDDRARIVPGAMASAADATVEQTKLIAHEVRNALVPVRYEIDALRSTLTEPNHLKRVEDARAGVARVLDFVESMVQTSERIVDARTGFDIAAAVEEAIGWVDLSRRVAWQRPDEALQVTAPRTRLTRAISNVVGNALQATTRGQHIRVSLARVEHAVRIVVDDGGPGVPVEHRQRVFLEGVTMRRDGGGSGFGLAFARGVVEGTLHGRIWCEDSDLGGARFVIEIPEPIV